MSQSVDHLACNHEKQRTVTDYGQHWLFEEHHRLVMSSSCASGKTMEQLQHQQGKEEEVNPGSSRLKALIQKNTEISDMVGNLRRRIRLRNALSLGNLSLTVPNMDDDVDDDGDVSSSEDSGCKTTAVSCDDEKKMIMRGQTNSPSSLCSSCNQCGSSADSGAMSDIYCTNGNAKLDDSASESFTSSSSPCRMNSSETATPASSSTSKTASCADDSYCRVHSCRILSIIAHCSQVASLHKDETYIDSSTSPDADGDEKINQLNKSLSILSLTPLSTIPDSAIQTTTRTTTTSINEKQEQKPQQKLVIVPEFSFFV